MSKLRTSGLAIGAGATILLSFATQWFILTRLGASRTTDSYFAALAVPLVALYVFGDPLSRVALPVLSVKTGAEYWTYAWTTVQTCFLLFLVIGAALFLSARIWVPLLVPGFSEEAVQRTVLITRVVVLGMIFQGTSIGARASWNGRGVFLWPSIAAVIGVAASLSFLVLALRRHGIIAAAWAFNLRFGVECLLLVTTLGSYRQPEWRDVRPFFRRARPLMLGAAYFRTDVLVDRVLTSLAPPGGLSLLYLAQQLLSAIGQVINQSVVTPSIPALARAAHAGDWRGFTGQVRSASRMLLALSASIMLGVLIFGGPGLSVVFAHQAMGAQDIHRLLFLMLALGGMLLADGIVYFSYSSFYSTGDTKTPTIATAVVYSVGVIAKILAFIAAGIVGLAVAISAYYAANAVVLLFLLRRKLRRFIAAGGVAPRVPEFAQPVPMGSSSTVEPI